MPYATVTDARNSTLRDEDLLNLAAYLVEHIAPPDTDPPSADYIARAERAERMVFRYLDKTDGGVLASRNLTGAGAETYASNPAIVKMISDVMTPADTHGGTTRFGIIR